MSSNTSDSNFKKFVDALAEAIKEIMEYPENNAPLIVTFQQYVEDEIIPYLMAKGKFKECQIIETSIVCSPCPYHDDPQDQYIINPLREFIAGCKIEEVRDSEFLTLNQVEMLKKIAKEGKITLRW